MKRLLSFLLSIFFIPILVQQPAYAVEYSTVFTNEITTAEQRDIIPSVFSESFDTYTRPITRGEFAELAVNFVASMYEFGGVNAFFYDRYFTYHTDVNGAPYNLKT